MNRVEIEKIVIKIVRVEVEVEGIFSPEDISYTANKCLREKLREVLRQVGISEEREVIFTYAVPISCENRVIKATFRGICIDKFWREEEIAE